ncbi:MAG: hypothetical protein GXY52_06680 [Chloroflexi bacterium]|nr:hypothetical protein [Chloroflexota bacterium]
MFKITVNPVKERGNGAATIPVIRYRLSEPQFGYDLVETAVPGFVGILPHMLSIIYQPQACA